ncbi:MAG: hypothetical protein V4539_16215 [Bacteroidota bacterium]
MKTIMCIALVICFCFRVGAQVQELEQLKMDLEKLAQLKLILSQMKQGYQVLENGYNSVRDVARGNFDLHKNYLDGLLVVNLAVKQSPVLQQISAEKDASEKLYITALRQYFSSGLFTSAELNSLHDRYNGYLQKVDDGLALLAQVTSSGKLRMNDAERLQAIDTIHVDVSAQFAEVNKMVNDYSRLMALRAQQKKDNDAFKKLSGLK